MILDCQTPAELQADGEENVDAPDVEEIEIVENTEGLDEVAEEKEPAMSITEE